MSIGPEAFFKQYHPKYPQMELYSSELNMDSFSVSVS